MLVSNTTAIRFLRGGTPIPFLLSVLAYDIHRILLAGTTTLGVALHFAI
jgi:hypothetical protein